MVSMAIRQHLIYCLLLAISLTSCSSVEKIEQVDDYDYKEVYFVSKKTKLKNGSYQKFAPDGTLYESAEYKDDILNGERKLMYPNGKLEIVENYVKGKFQGITKNFFEDGQLRNEGQFDDNIAVGIWKSYYSNGQLKEEVTYADNQEQGPFKEWHENGNIKAEGTYKNGDNEHGELKLFDDNGQLLRKMNCQMGACKTTWKSAKVTDET